MSSAHRQLYCGPPCITITIVNGTTTSKRFSEWILRNMSSSFLVPLQQMYTIMNYTHPVICIVSRFSTLLETKIHQCASNTGSQWCVCVYVWWVASTKRRRNPQADVQVPYYVRRHSSVESPRTPWLDVTSPSRTLPRPVNSRISSSRQLPQHSTATEKRRKSEWNGRKSFFAHSGQTCRWSVKQPFGRSSKAPALYPGSPTVKKLGHFFFCNIFGFCWPTLAAFTVVIRYDLRERMM